MNRKVLGSYSFKLRILTTLLVCEKHLYVVHLQSDKYYDINGKGIICRCASD